MTQTKRCPIFKFGSWWALPQQKSLAENDATAFRVIDADEVERWRLED